MPSGAAYAPLGLQVHRRAAVKAKRLRKIAQRCRDLLRAARRPDVQEQLREWVKEAEADAGSKPPTRKLSGAQAAD